MRKLRQLPFPLSNSLFYCNPIFEKLTGFVKQIKIYDLSYDTNTKYSKN